MRPAVATCERAPRRRASRLTARSPPSPRPAGRPRPAPIAYHGIRTEAGDALVLRRAGEHVALLDLRRDVDDVSIGFEWGYFGQGPLQLAVALLTDAIGPDVARRISWGFCERVTSALHRADGWTLTRNDVRAHARALEGRG